MQFVLFIWVLQFGTNKLKDDSDESLFLKVILFRRKVMQVWQKFL